MMECTDNPRDRAIIHVLYEGGFRLSELLGMTMKDISFDQYGAVARVNGKTGDRRVGLIGTRTEAIWIVRYGQIIAGRTTS